MSLAIRGIEANLGKEPTDPFTRDLHQNTKFDFILSNPPFNVGDWSGQLLREEPRCKRGVPPMGKFRFGQGFEKKSVRETPFGCRVQIKS